MHNNLQVKEPENDWANDVKDNPIHISQAESGLKGYYCMGCNKEMQAVKMKNPKHQSYFGNLSGYKKPDRFSRGLHSGKNAFFLKKTKKTRLFITGISQLATFLRKRMSM
jgi:hypothetical protein